jgi:hypothetical protein
MLGARWAQLDPKHMFNSIYADSFSPEDSPGAFPYRTQLGSVLFEEWAKNDLAGAVKALTDAPDFSTRESYRMTLASAAMKENVEQGLRLMKDWQIRNFLPDMKKLTEWAAHDPQHAAEIVLQLGSDYAGQQALREVGRAWGQVDPEGGLRFAARLDPAARSAIGSELMRQWAQKSPTAAAAFAAAQGDMAYRATLGQGLVSTWALTDPTNALAWSQQHLRGSARAVAVADVISVLAERNLTTASQIVADMEPGGMQNRACASIFQAWFNKGANERNAAFDWLASLPDEDARRMALERVQWNGAFRDPDTLREFLVGPHGAMAPDYVVAQVASTHAMKDPDAAMRWAATLPPSRGPTARMEVLASWLSQRPEQAQAYVRAMPAGSERQEAVQHISVNFVQQSPERAAEWYRTLPTADQQIARQAFQQIGLSVDQRKALEDALKE